MASYQDIETRLRVAEDKLDFFMKQFVVTKRSLSATLDAAGRPTVKEETTNLLNVYHESRNGTFETTENGTDAE